MMTVQAEKQVYQLELVNREKNYNQIFSASPCVGVLDPLKHTKVRPPHPTPPQEESIYNVYSPLATTQDKHNH